MSMKSGHRPGGGIASNKKTEVGVKTGSGAHGKNPGHVGQIGVAVDRKAVEERGRPAPETRFGNEVALNVGGGGPGVGREVFRSGGQGTHGPVNPGNAPAKNRDILGGFGPEKSS
jgi:hypothetical protein